MARALTEKFRQGDVPLVFVVTAPDRYDSPQARAVATDIIDTLGDPDMSPTSPPWNLRRRPGGSTQCRQRSGLIVTGIVGARGRPAKATHRELTDEIAGDRDGITVLASGPAMVNLQVTEQSKQRPPGAGGHRGAAQLPGVDLGVRRPFRRRAPAIVVRG